MLESVKSVTLVIVVHSVKFLKHNKRPKRKDLSKQPPALITTETEVFPRQDILF